MDSMEKEFPQNASVIVGELIKLKSKMYFNNLANIVSQTKKHSKELQKLKTELESTDERMNVI